MARGLSFMQLPSRGVMAFVPVRAQSGTAATNGVWKVTGSPGVVPIPIPRPAGLPPLNGGPNANQAQGGDPAGGGALFIRPTIYTYQSLNTSQLRRVSDNVLPTPAEAVVRSPSRRMRAAHIGGRRVTSWPKPSINWPTWGGGTTS